MKPTTHKERTESEKPSWNGQYENYCGGGGLNQIYSRETSPLILLQPLVTNIFSVRMRSCTSSVKHHSETHIFKYTVIKHSQWANTDLKPEHKKTKNKTTISPTANNNSQAPNILIW